MRIFVGSNGEKDPHQMLNIYGSGQEATLPCKLIGGGCFDVTICVFDKILRKEFLCVDVCGTANLLG